jgi:ATP-dependent DNA helicase RecQ
MFALADAAGCRQQSLVRYFDETMEACGSSCDRCRDLTLVDLIRTTNETKPLKTLGGPFATTGGARGAGGAGDVDAADEDLFQKLRALRRSLADAENVPAYIVFSDAVLARMAAARPSDDAGLLAIAGVGPAKLARYGAEFLRVLRDA